MNRNNSFLLLASLAVLSVQLPMRAAAPDDQGHGHAHGGGGSCAGDSADDKTKSLNPLSNPQSNPQLKSQLAKQTSAPQSIETPLKKNQADAAPDREQLNTTPPASQSAPGKGKPTQAGPAENRKGSAKGKKEKIGWMQWGVTKVASPFSGAWGYVTKSASDGDDGEPNNFSWKARNLLSQAVHPIPLLAGGLTACGTHRLCGGLEKEVPLLPLLAAFAAGDAAVVGARGLYHNRVRLEAIKRALAEQQGPDNDGGDESQKGALKKSKSVQILELTLLVAKIKNEFEREHAEREAADDAIRELREKLTASEAAQEEFRGDVDARLAGHQGAIELLAKPQGVKSSKTKGADVSGFFQKKDDDGAPGGDDAKDES